MTADGATSAAGVSAGAAVGAGDDSVGITVCAFTAGGGEFVLEIEDALGCSHPTHEIATDNVHHKLGLLSVMVAAYLFDLVATSAS